MLINVLLKGVFLRDRPSFSDPILTLAGYSFPSGHVAGATLFYGVLAAFLASNVRTWRSRVLIVLAACVLVILVGITRIYLGLHHLSDVVAAAAVKHCLAGTLSHCH
jgi:membrane-associated phospholipid phosphatase